MLGRLYDKPVDGDIGYYTAVATQNFLINNNFNPGAADGKWGTLTSKAMQCFLQSKGYSVGPIDGILFKGKISTTAFQQWLQSEDEDPGPIDGIFGYLTTCAWQRYLKINKITGESKAEYGLLFSCTGGVSGKRNIKVTVGIKNSSSYSSEFTSSLTASISGPIKALTAGIEGSVGYAMSSTTSVEIAEEVTKEIEIDFENPCYIYQMIVRVPTRFGEIIMRSNEHISNKPIKCAF